MSDCQCDDDMTEDGHGAGCPNGITALRAERDALAAKVVALNDECEARRLREIDAREAALEWKDKTEASQAARRAETAALAAKVKELEAELSMVRAGRDALEASDECGVDGIPPCHAKPNATEADWCRMCLKAELATSRKTEDQSGRDAATLKMAAAADRALVEMWERKWQDSQRDLAAANGQATLARELREGRNNALQESASLRGKVEKHSDALVGVARALGLTRAIMSTPEILAAAQSLSADLAAATEKVRTLTEEATKHEGELDDLRAECEEQRERVGRAERERDEARAACAALLKPTKALIDCGPSGVYRAHMFPLWNAVGEAISAPGAELLAAHKAERHALAMAVAGKVLRACAAACGKGLARANIFTIEIEALIAEVEAAR